MFDFSNGLLVKLIHVFFNETDRYVRQSKRGSYYVVGDYNTVDGRRTLVKPHALRLQILEQHLLGDIVIGTYTTSEEDTCKWACFDFDGKPTQEGRMCQWARVSRFAYRMWEAGVPTYVEFSGNKGWHAWVFFEQPIPAAIVYPWMHAAWERCGDTETIEFYPKQATLKATGKGTGNLVKLPYGKHLKSGWWTWFTFDGKTPLPIDVWLAQVKYLTRLPDWKATAPVITAVDNDVYEFADPRFYDVPCLKGMLERAPDEGAWNNTLFSISLLLWRAGIGRATAHEITRKWTARFRGAGYCDGERQTTVDSAYRGVYQGPPCNQPWANRHCSCACFRYARYHPKE